MPWDTDTSSGFLTGFKGEITDAYFNTDPRYNNGESLLLHFDIKIDEVTQDGYEGEIPEEFTQSYPLGPGWYSNDNKVAVHKQGKTKFHASSLYGKIIDAVTGKVQNYGENATRTDGEDLVVDLTALADVLAQRGDPEQADIWSGVRLEFAEVHFDFGPDKEAVKAGETGKRIESRRAMPVAFLGLAGEDAAPAPSSAPAQAAPEPAAAPAAEAPAAVDAVAAAKARAKAAAAAAQSAAQPAESGNPFSTLTDNAVLADQLNTALAGAASYTAFVDAVLEFPEVATNDALLAAVLDDTNGPAKDLPPT